MHLRFIVGLILLSFAVPKGATACVGGSLPPGKNLLGQNIPNPFNPTTSIPYVLARGAHVMIGIYDVSGTRVIQLDEGVRAPGAHVVRWNGRDTLGRALPGGVYFYRFDGPANPSVRKMVLLK